MDRFRTPPGEAQVGSRLDGSTVFSISPGPFLAPTLGSFWDPLGTHGSTIFAQGPPGPPGWAPLGPPAAPPDPLGAALVACFVSSLASSTPCDPRGPQNDPKMTPNLSKMMFFWAEYRAVLNTSQKNNAGVSPSRRVFLLWLLHDFWGRVQGKRTLIKSTSLP